MASERRASQPLGLALCGSVPRRGGTYGRRPTAVKTPRATKPHPPRISRRERSRDPGPRAFRHPSAPMPTTERLVLRSWRPSDRAPFARLNADPEVVRVPQRRRARSRAPQSDELFDAIEAHWDAARLRPVVRGRARGPRRVPGLRRAGRARRSCRRCCPRSRSAGAWPARRGGAGWPPRARERLCAMPSRSSARGGDLDHRPGQRALDPRGARSSGMRRGRASRASANAPQIARIRDFFARCGLFTRPRLDPCRSRSHTFGPDAEPSRRERGPGVARPAALKSRRSFGS